MPNRKNETIKDLKKFFRKKFDWDLYESELIEIGKFMEGYFISKLQEKETYYANSRTGRLPD